jgi:hypothetical protein
MVWEKLLFIGNSPDIGNTETCSNCNSSHIDSEIFFHSSQYANFSKTHPYPSRNLFLDVFWLGLFSLI